MNKKILSHIAGTFLIQADGAFLNGAGLGEGEDRNVTIPKTFRDGRGEVPYVSSQAWKRWLRNTFIEETDWPESEVKAIGWNPKGNVNKIASELNPVDFPEDDIFGYMRAQEGQGKKGSGEEEGTEEGKTSSVRTKSVMRASPFMASVLISLRSAGWKGEDEGFVHLTRYDPLALAEAEIERFLSSIPNNRKDKKKTVWERLSEIDSDLAKKIKFHLDDNNLDLLRKELSKMAKERNVEVAFIENPCSPLPYTTRFYNTHLQGIFCLDYGRLGTYWNLGDRIELEEAKANKLIQDGKLAEVTNKEPYKTLSNSGRIGKVYRITKKVEHSPKERALELFKALSVLRGGAKQAQFGTDVSPKVLILAGLTCGNPIFNHLFKDNSDGPILKLETLKEIIIDYSDRIVTPVLIGIRSGYLQNESEVRLLNEKTLSVGQNENKKEVKILVMSPLEAAQKIGAYIPNEDSVT